ncbi:hypothetical protein N431DRAFT_488584 [Stipitochalara longipes BDJ]|nr:hypothetical protein N431DRAFT_488584 [Stipitochalara longipes BDJ]
MAQNDWYTNIMLDLECASVEAHNPVLIELAAVHFDIDTGEELGHYSSIISYQSCLDHDLVDDIVNGEDGETTRFLKRDPILKYTLLESKDSEILLEHVLANFTTFVKESCQRTLEVQRMRSPPRRYTQPMIWGNGAVADNVWITSAYKACNMERPWKFYNNMCVRTFVQQAKIITGRDFKSEIENGQKHDALSDCRTQLEYLVNARNALIPQPAERMLHSPETSFSIVEVQVEQAFRRELPSPETIFSSIDGPVEQVHESTASSLDEFEETLSEHEAILEILMSSQEIPEEENNVGSGMAKPGVTAMLLSPEASFSSTEGDVEQALRSAASSLLDSSLSNHGAPLEMLSSSDVSIHMKAQETGGQELAMTAPMQNSASASSNGHRIRDFPYKVTKSESNGNQRRRGAPMNTPRQLLTPETSFNTEDLEKE